MQAKDLVELYESPFSDSSHGPSNEPHTNGPDDIPAPRPARFIKRGSSDAPWRVRSRRDRDRRVPTALRTDSVSSDTIPLLPLRESSRQTVQQSDFTREDPPSAHSITAFDFASNSATYPQEPGHAHHIHSPHAPVPAVVLFGRNAAPLHLPKLDDYLSTVTPPEFKEPPGTMFPPMDKLAELGRTLDDMEHNATVIPSWRNRRSILNGTITILIGLLGSSALASFYSLHGLINTLQIFALLLSTIGGGDNAGKWRTLVTGTIPNILAFNFASVVAQSLLLLFVFSCIGCALFWYFYHSTVACDRYTSIEGLQRMESRGRQWGIVIVTLLLIIVYLPLTTMSVHVLVWSEELWPIPNPYVNTTTPSLPPLGPSHEFRDPLDFCWTTTMKRNEVNFSPLAIILAVVTVAVIGVWFPFTLRRAIQQSVPKVDKFTDLGRQRSTVDMNSEYHRLLSRDRNPFAFLYNNFRRGWATYISTYLFAKLSALLIIAIISPDNCLFRSVSRTKVAVVRQSLLVVSTVGFFVAQCILAPFLDPVNNASEWTSRLNYLTTSATALAVALNIPGKEIVNSYVLYSIYIVTYGLGFYFLVIDFNWMQRIIKKITRRIDFSIDIFSPRLDVATHNKRRIWQETVSVLLLTDPDCKIPEDQSMHFAQSRDSEFPPYLLNFSGTPGERHVENIRILREAGNKAYKRAVALLSGPDFAWYRYLQDEIQKNHIGPDSYWKPKDGGIKSCTSHFGNAWWLPFPPTLVIRYDDGPYGVITSVADLAEYIKQNSSKDVSMRRRIRMSLRALEGQIVRWPYEHVHTLGSQSIWCCGCRRYNAISSTSYEYAVLRIKRQGHLVWRGLHLGSGFSLSLKYSKTVKLSGDIIGLNEDYDLTPTLARFLAINKDLIDESLYYVEERISHYRRYHRKQCRLKARTLSYKFLATIYDSPSHTEESLSCLHTETDRRVCVLMSSSQHVFASAHARLNAVSRSEATAWWYIFWDDLWRRNRATISAMEKHASDFDPHYPSSIAYRPLPRAALEAFLAQRGLLHPKPKWGDFFHAGFLNKLYARLNEAVFKDSSRVIMYHLGNDKRELDMEDIDILTQGESSTLGTGGGTDHDISGFRPRPTYRWEGLLQDPRRDGGSEGRKKWLSKLGAWFGVTPLWRAGFMSNGISLDVKLENGRYVLLGDRLNAPKRDSSGRPSGISSS